MDPDAIYEAPISKAKVFSSFLLLGIIFLLLFSILSHVDITVSSRGKFVTSFQMLKCRPLEVVSLRRLQ